MNSSLLTWYTKFLHITQQLLNKPLEQVISKQKNDFTQRKDHPTE